MRIEDDKANTQLHDAKMTASTAASRAAEAEKNHLIASEALALSLQSEAEASAEYQRLRLAVEECDKEAQRIETAISQLHAQMAQIESDEARENSLQNDAQKALSDLADEKQQLQSQRQISNRS